MVRDVDLIKGAYSESPGSIKSGMAWKLPFTEKSRRVYLSVIPSIPGMDESCTDIIQSFAPVHKWTKVPYPAASACQ